MKPRIIKSFENLDSDILNQIHSFYPFGFEEDIISFKLAEGKFCKALPFETNEYSYLIKINSESKFVDYEEEQDLAEAEREINQISSREKDSNFF